jgi:NADH-quinone oxidoreductase subunit L
MFLAVGIGAFSAAIFHLFTHAFFKACLFLGSGSVIHALDGEQDMRKMGGLRNALPQTYWTYLVATLAIAGIPFTAGFFSKDLILWKAFEDESYGLWSAGIITAGLTAFYMFRQLFMVFHGSSRAGDHTKAHIHESPPEMTVPLVILAVGSIFSGWLSAPEYLWGSVWDQWLQPVFGATHSVEHVPASTELLVTAITLAMVVLGIYLAYARYGRARATVPAAAAETGLYRLLLDGYGIDEIYDRLVVRPYTAASDWLARVFDPAVIDGVINGVAKVTRGFSLIWREAQTGNIQHYLIGFLAGTLALLYYYLRQQ